MVVGAGGDTAEMGLPVAERIRRLSANLTPGERKIARALMADYPSAGLQPSAELARLAGVSAPTVVRFAIALGFNGYRELQQALTGELSERGASPLTMPISMGQGTPLAQLREHSLTILTDGLSRTLTQLPDVELGRAIDLLVDPRRRITSFGGRFTHLLAEYLDMHLRLLRPDTQVHPEAPVRHAGFLADLGKRDVCVVFDVRRYQQDIVELARYADGRGATIVLVTDPWLSPAAAFADVVLSAVVGSPSPFDSLVAVTAVVETLVAGVYPALEASARTRMERVEAAIDGPSSGAVLRNGS